jgi:uncharacterized membrane protein
MGLQMSINEKRAWFGLAICVLATVAILALYQITGSAGRAMGGLGVLGLLGLQPVIGLSRKRCGEVIEDERDLAIRQRAGAQALGVVWVCAVAACLGVYAEKGERGVVPVGGLILAVWAAYVLFTLVYSLTVIWKYRKSRAEG